MSKKQKADSTLRDRDSLIEEYGKYVRALVGRMIRAMGLPAECHDEFVSAGYLGLVEAAQRFEPSSGADFKTFAFLRIRGAVIDSIRENSDLSGRAYRCAKALQAVQDLREDEVSRPPLRGSSRLAEILNHAAQGALAFRLSIGDGTHSVRDIPDPQASAYERIEEQQTFAQLSHLVTTLPEKERVIVEQYYYKGRSFKEIADSEEGMSKSWVSRLHARAVERLRMKFMQELEGHGSAGHV